MMPDTAARRTAARTAIRDEATRLRAVFEAAGAQVVDPPVLQPADTLLDL